MTAPDQSIDVRLDAREDGAVVAFVTIRNTARLNSLNSALMEQFVSTLAALEAREGLRAVVLSGAGEKAFVGGADISEMAHLDPSSARSFITRVHRCCEAVRELPVPVIARIRGHVLGAGLELAAACDLRAAADDARFGMPEVLLGIPSVVEAALLPGIVGWGRAREILLLGETFGAADAERWGLVERVVPASQIDVVVDAWLAAIARTGSNAVRLQKRLIRRWESLPMREAIAAGIDAFSDAWTVDEPRRLMGEFEARRAARRKR